MDNDVAVTRLTDGDGWGDRVPPGPRSRHRVLAVMGAVVVGCGVAAVAVNSVGGDTREIRQPDDVAVIVVPDEHPDGSAPDLTPTSGLSPISATSSTTRTDESTTGSESSSSTTTPATESSSTEASPTSDAPTPTPEPPPPPPPSDPPPQSSSQPPPPPPTTTTTRRRDRDDDGCWLFFC